MENTNIEQTQLNQVENAAVETNHNNNAKEPNKKRGMKRGAVVGTLGGIFLGGAGAAYAIEHDITMSDIEEGINDIVNDANKTLNPSLNNETPAETPVEGEVALDAEVVAETEVVAEAPAEGEAAAEAEVAATAEEERLTSKEVFEAIKDAVLGEEQAPVEDAPVEGAPVEGDDRLTGAEVLDALKSAVADEQVAEEAAATEEAVVAEQTEAAEDEFNTIETDDLIVHIDDSVAIAENISDELSFDEAFAAARAAVGAGGAFEWRGGVYGTYYAEEWEAMSDEEKAEFGDQFEFNPVEEEQTPLDTPLDELLAEPEQTPLEVTVDELVAEEVAEPALEDEQVAEAEAVVDAEPEVEVVVENVYDVNDAFDNKSAYVNVTVAGEDVQLVDNDGDGVVDVMAYDENGDGVVEEAEMVTISEEGLMVEDFVEMVEEPAEEPIMDDVVADDFAADDIATDDIAADDLVM